MEERPLFAVGEIFANGEHQAFPIAGTKMASHAEVNDVVAEVNSFADDPQTILSLPRIFRCGRILGFGVTRPFLIGWKIGPLFADSTEVADALFQSFQLASQGMPIFLDVPDNNPPAIALCLKYKIRRSLSACACIMVSAPLLDHRRIFGITTLEVG